MSSSWYAALVLVVLSCSAWWLAGNSYEAVVIAPKQLRGWRSGGHDDLRIDPRLFYIPTTVVGLLAGIAASIEGERNSYRGSALVLAATVCYLVGNALTAYAVLTINEHVFFYKPAKPTPDQGAALMLKWMRLNVARIGLLVLACALLVRVVWLLLQARP